MRCRLYFHTTSTTHHHIVKIGSHYFVLYFYLNANLKQFFILSKFSAGFLMLIFCKLDKDLTLLSENKRMSQHLSL